jgi:hypothetical protein
MNEQNVATTEFSKFKAVRRKAVSLSQEALVKTNYLAEGQNFPLVTEPGGGERRFTKLGAEPSRADRVSVAAS